MLLALLTIAEAACRWTGPTTGDAGDDWIQVGSTVWDVRSRDEMDRVWNALVQCQWKASETALRSWFDHQTDAGLQNAFADAVARDSLPTTATDADREAAVARAREARSRLAEEQVVEEQARRAAGPAKVPLVAADTCALGIGTEVRPTFLTHEALVEQEAAAAGAEMRAPRAVPGAAVTLQIGGLSIESADPGNLLVIVQNSAGAEVLRQRLEHRTPEVPVKAGALWTGFGMVTLRTPSFPMKLFVADTITPSRCAWTVDQYDPPVRVAEGR